MRFWVTILAVSAAAGGAAAVALEGADRYWACFLLVAAVAFLGAKWLDDAERVRIQRASPTLTPTDELDRRGQPVR